MYIVFTSFKHPKLPISINIANFEFMNHLFANLLVAWL